MNGMMELNIHKTSNDLNDEKNKFYKSDSYVWVTLYMPPQVTEKLAPRDSRDENSKSVYGIETMVSGHLFLYFAA